MRQPLHNIRGETLAETIIALMILAIGITFSGTIMAASLKNMTSSKTRVVAVNLAREGIEAMRSVRDTNWLKFSGQRRGCWNHIPQGDSDTCDGTALFITPGDYIVYKDESHRWRLAPATADNRLLFTMDIDAATDTDGIDNDPLTDETGNGNKTDDGLVDDADIYNHRLNVPNTAISNNDDPLGFQRSKSTPFTRVIRVEYLDDSGTIDPDTANNRMEVTSTVTWSTDRDFTVELKTHLTDYLGRENLNE